MNYGRVHPCTSNGRNGSAFGEQSGRKIEDVNRSPTIGKGQPPPGPVHSSAHSPNQCPVICIVTFRMLRFYWRLPRQGQNHEEWHGKAASQWLRGKGSFQS